MTEFRELKLLKSIDKKTLNLQKGITLVIHYHSSLSQALDLVKNSETSIPLADYFNDETLTQQYGPINNLGKFRFAKKYLNIDDVIMLTTLLTNIENLELVILSQEQFSKDQAVIFAKLFSEWGDKIKDLKIWVKAGIIEREPRKRDKNYDDDDDEEEEDENEIRKISFLEVALFAPIKTEFTVLENLTLDVWEFVVDDFDQKLYPTQQSDVREVELNGRLRTIKTFNFGSRNNCISPWSSVMDEETINNNALCSLSVTVPFGRQFEQQKSKMFNDLPRNIKTLVLQGLEETKIGERFRMVGVIVEDESQLRQVLNTFPQLISLSVELSKNSTLNESDIINLIAIHKLKLIDLRIYFACESNVNKPFGAKFTQSLPELMSLTLGPFSIDLFSNTTTDPKHGKLDLTELKKVAPNCRGLVLRLSHPYYLCDDCNDTREHFTLVLKESKLANNYIDVIRLDFCSITGQISIDYNIASREFLLINEFKQNLNYHESNILSVQKMLPPQSPQPPSSSTTIEKEKTIQMQSEITKKCIQIKKRPPFSAKPISRGKIKETQFEQKDQMNEMKK